MQRKLLEESFQVQKYLSVKQRNKLAKEVDLSPEQVKTWYQNRRTRWRRNKVAKVNEHIWRSMQYRFNLRKEESKNPIDPRAEEEW